MQELRTACKEAAWVFILSRIVIAIISYIGFITISEVQQTLAHNCVHLVCIYYHWDVQAYVHVAYQGYRTTQDVVFFPLWALIERVGGLLLGGRYPISYYIAGLLLANACFYVVLVLLYRLLSEDFEPSLARRTLFYLAFSPAALFFFLGYTEALFLLLCIGVFLLLRRGKALDWWFAGILGFLAALTRSSGVVLAVPFLVMYIQRFWIPDERSQHNWLQKLSAFAPITLIPAGVLLYMLYLWHAKGNPFIISTEETLMWHRHFAPLTGYVTTIQLLLAHSLSLLNVMKNVIDVIFSLIFLAVLALGWKRLPLHYSLFALALAVFALSFPLTVTEPLASVPRYLTAIFPITVIFASWGKQPRFDQCYISLALPLFAMNVLLFITHNWVA